MKPEPAVLSQNLFSDAGSQEIEPLNSTLALALSDRSLVSEEFRLLAAKIRGLGQERAFRCFGVVSASAGEGKTTLTLGLATALARDRESRVLLIEGDLRRPAMERYLGIPNVPGLSDWIEGSHQPMGLRSVMPTGFKLLSAGTQELRHSEAFGSPRMNALLQAARRSFDWVIIDCPPVTPVADAIMFQDYVDGFLLVVRARHSPRETLQGAVGRIKPGRIVGIVFNDQKEILHNYYSYGYRHYG
jgi:capsular exopolysaccharide synthesis family protein